MSASTTTRPTSRITFNADWLDSVGLGLLPPEVANDLLAHAYQTLEMNVGMRLAEEMTNGQLDEFESFIDRKDEAGALSWLEHNFPHYKAIVSAEFELLTASVRAGAPRLLAGLPMPSGAR